MSEEARVKINPETLRRAIERARTTPEKLAEQLGIDVKEVSGWIEGNSLPTHGQLSKVSEILDVAFSRLLTDCDFDDLDSRILKSFSSVAKRVDAYTSSMILKVMQVRDWARGIHCNKKNSHVGMFIDSEESAEKFVKSKFEHLVGCKTSPAEFFGKVEEEMGCYCFTGKSADGFRGVVLVDPCHPVIAVNEAVSAEEAEKTLLEACKKILLAESCLIGGDDTGSNTGCSAPIGRIYSRRLAGEVVSCVRSGLVQYTYGSRLLGVDVGELQDMVEEAREKERRLSETVQRMAKEKRDGRGIRDKR